MDRDVQHQMRASPRVPPLLFCRHLLGFSYWCEGKKINTLAPRNLQSRLFFSFLRRFLGHRAVSYPSLSLRGHVWKPTFSSRVGLFIHMQIVFEADITKIFSKIPSKVKIFQKLWFTYFFLLQTYKTDHLRLKRVFCKTKRCIWAVEKCYRYHKM